MVQASSALIAISSISAEDLRFQQRFLDLRIRSLKAAVGLVSAVHGDASLLGVPVKEFEALAKEWHAISLVGTQVDGLALQPLRICLFCNSCSKSRGGRWIWLSDMFMQR